MNRRRRFTPPFFIITAFLIRSMLGPIQATAQVDFSFFGPTIFFPNSRIRINTALAAAGFLDASADKFYSFYDRLETSTPAAALSDILTVCTSCVLNMSDVWIAKNEPFIN